MIIKYENGEQIITHPSGVVTRYSSEYLQQLRDNEQELLNHRGSYVIALDAMIAEAQASKK